MTEPTAIDPTDCGCTECLTGRHIPLDYATRFDVPVPGHPGVYVVARKAPPGYVIGTQWAVTDDSDMGSNAWTGHHWVYRGELHREQIYAYDRDQAVAEAKRVAPLVAEDIVHRRAALIRARALEAGQ